jgi:hypothetical protein
MKPVGLKNTVPRKSTAQSSKTIHTMSKKSKTAPLITALEPILPQVAHASTSQEPTTTTAFEALANLDQSEKVKVMAKKVLEEKNAKSHKNAMTGSQIYNDAVNLFPRAGVPENTFKQYLSRCVKDPTSEINRLSQKQGYYLSAAAKALENKADEPAIEPQSKIDEGRREKEKLLYPVLQNWLIEQEYRAKITALGRSNGQWGNPDITGIMCDESFGNVSLEVATIEVKLSDKGWKQWIFEAVSHRRFSNRSYFAFAYPAELIKKLDSELRYFSELYQVGVLVIAMEQAQFEELQRGKTTTPVADEDVDIIELYSAPYARVQTRFQKEYLQSLKITSTPEVARWGQGLEDNE